MRNDCYPSRSEKREELLTLSAEKGEFSIKYLLYKAEIKKLEKEGFKIMVKESNISKDLYNCTIDWSNPFKEGIPNIVYLYICDIVRCRPRKNITNFAQNLFVIASKKSLENNN